MAKVAGGVCVMDVKKNVWALVLAGGQGNRLAALTSNLHGVVVPKQFCSLPSVLAEPIDA